MREIQKKYRLAESEIAYLADDLFDIPLLRTVGLSGAPKNARPEVRRVVHFVTAAAGGDGAVREFVEFILGHRGKRRR